MADYMDYSFDGIVQKLKEKLKEKGTWKDITESSVGTTLIELIAYGVQEFAFFVQRAFEEIFTDSAQFYESLVRLGNLIGYKVRRPQGALATLKIYPGTSDVTISKGTTIQINGYDFYFPSDVVVSASDDYTTATVRQGTATTYSFTVSTSEAFMKFKFGNEDITDTDLWVDVDGTEWERTDYVLLADEGTLYEIATLPDKSMELRFGVQSTGLPLSGQTVTVHCYEVVGKDANYFGSSPDFSGEVSGLTAEVIPPITGGGDIEDTDSLRENIPLAFRLVSGFVAKRDYEIFVSNIPGVLKAKAMDVKDDKLVPFRTVRIYVLPEGGYEMSDSFKDQLQTRVEQLIPTGVNVEIKDPLIRDVRVGMGIRVKRGYITEQVTAAVYNAITNLYDPKNIDFGEWITLSKLAQTALMQAGVLETNVYYPKDDILTMKPYEICKLIQLDITPYS